MNYHTYECDRCGKKERVPDFPKYWASLRINDTNRSYSPITDADLCNHCMPFVYSTLQQTLPAKREPEFPEPESWGAEVSGAVHKQMCEEQQKLRTEFGG